MEKNIERIVEEGKGSGRLFENNLHLVDVQYEYKILQKFDIIESPIGKQELPG